MNASSSNQVQGETDLKLCKVCGETIKISAIKCIHYEIRAIKNSMLMLLRFNAERTQF